MYISYAKWECMASAEVHEICIQATTQTSVSNSLCQLCYPYIMDQGKVAHYRNQNVRFDVDFIAKTNVSLGTGSVKKGWKF